MTMQEWLAERSDVEFSTVFLRGGPLLPDFRTIGPVFDVAGLERNRSTSERIATRLGVKFPSAIDRLARSIELKGPFDILYSNTIVSSSGISAFLKCAPLVVSHIHELPTLIRWSGEENIDVLKKYADQILAGSNAVRDGLINSFSFEPARIAVVNGFISLNFGANIDKPRAASALRARLNLPASALIVGVCGTGGLHKGHDLVPQLLLHLPPSILGREVHVVHVGAFMSQFDFALLRRDAEVLGVSQRLHYVGAQPDVAPWTAGFDVLAFPSREDAFGLVLLEAARFGIPSVCFAQSGGAPEICEGGAGVVVPYLRADLMAQALCTLLEDETLRRATGLKAEQKFLGHHHVDSAMSAWLELIRRLIRDKGRSVTS